MVTPPVTRKSRYAPAVVTKNELLELLNDDFTRECRAIYAHAVFAERLKHKPEASEEVSRLGQGCVIAALTLCQIIYDYGGSTSHNIDELNAVLSADNVATMGWEDTTLRRLHERAGQLRAAGEPGLAKRLRRIVTAKRRSASLSDFVSVG